MLQITCVYCREINFEAAVDGGPAFRYLEDGWAQRMLPDGGYEFLCRFHAKSSAPVSLDLEPAEQAD